MDIEKIKQIFDEYVYKYDMNELPIKQKYEHSYRVMNICNQIAKDLNLNEEDTKLAMVIGLLHDYARFEQWDKFKTFYDEKSIDHGDLAVKILFADNHIDKFDIPLSYYEIIYEAIKFHNKYGYPNNIPEKNEMFCKLIKDADKLDIFYLTSIGEIELFDDDSDVNEIISSEFYKEKLLRKEDRKTNSDKIIFKLAMMYDFNFKYSYKYIKEKGIVDKIFDLVNRNKKLEPYFNYIDKYVEEGSKQYVRKKI